MKRAIIGGTGFYDMSYMDDAQSQVIRTPFGGATVYSGRFQGEEIGFLPRHGSEHNQLAHQVNYRANIWALRELGVDRVLGTSAVGSLNPEMQVGNLVVLDNLVDFAKHRSDTFNLGSVDFTHPYCPEMRQIISAQAEQTGIHAHPAAIYLSVEGPRYETAAEINLWRKLGMDVVGMTNGTEAALARELGLCYAVIALVTDLAAGLQATPPDLETHKNVAQENLPKLRELALAALVAFPDEHGCPCYDQRANPRP
jgi:5'-methylthioadenosine phosphorylase